jgi:hypothetical protein
MNPISLLLLAVAATAACASDDPAPQPPPLPTEHAAIPDPAPVPVNVPAPVPVPVPGLSEEPVPPKDPPPKDPPPKTPLPPEEKPKTTPEARALLDLAAKRQGTAEMVGPKAPDRFRAFFATVILHSENEDRLEVTDTNEAFALPAGVREARVRSEYVQERKRVVLGHDGRFGWMKEGAAPARVFDNRERYAEDIRDLDQRRRMLRLSLRVFFLGGLADGRAPVTLLPDEEKDFPVGHKGKSKAVKCRVLERAADEAAGEPKLRIWLDAGTLDPVAVLLTPARPEEPSFLLTIAFDSDEIRKGKKFPAGVRVPDWLELFEIPPANPPVPAIRVQASISGLDIDPAKVPDSLFEVPK